MKKRLAGMLTCLMLFSAIQIVCAESRATAAGMELTFSGETATCEVTVNSFGKEIDLTMELWEGNTIMYKWYGSGSPSVELIRRATVRKGKSYTLKASGTVGGEAFVVTPVTRTCPN